MTFQITDEDSEICAKAIQQMTAEQFYLFMKLVNAINDNEAKITELINVSIQHDCKIAELGELKMLVDLR